MHKPRGPTNRIVAEGITHPDQVTHTEKKKITDQDALAEQRGRFMYSGRTWQKSLSCRWKEMMSQLMSRLSGSKASYLDRWDLNKTTSGLKLGCGEAGKEHRASKRFVSCSRSSWLTLAFCYPTQTTRGGGAYGTDTGTVHAHTAFRQFLKQPEKCKRRVSPHSKLHKELQATSETAIQITHQPQQNVTFPYSSRIPSSTTAFLVFICWYSTVCSSDIIMCLYD